MKDNYLDKIEEINPEEFPFVELSMDDINGLITSTKNKINKVIDELKIQNPSVNINITLDEALQIRKNLIPTTSHSMYCVEDANLMKEIMLKTVTENEGFQEGELVSELFAKLNGFMWYWKAPVWQQFFLTCEKLIVYSFDAWWTITNRYEVPINQIEYAGLLEEQQSFGAKGDFVIKAPDGKIFYFNPKSVDNKDELVPFFTTLNDLGVKKTSKRGFIHNNKVAIIFWIIAIIIFMFIFTAK